ncbi:hypothetical protein ABWK29_29070 [Priestia megaterium]|jgi:hypothetical protein|uniref:Uncharacterized protein n=3 Tax=Priestia megaterium TaxID=1404 RepID=A0AAE5P797_PRIMG|nr:MULTISPECIES: hypothetical protein [Priestia]RFB21896.1 hypothetical protein DZB87_24470 [Bacillus sp. ALD]RFB34307.1 hypothetical protein DZB86_24285 [Bacillus sp. RC]MBX9983776.1 hypothetical protein [Priestia aryabhattai]MBY0003582.1 hypothetical protein [Priestia aryabhattai]MCA4157057.1 hypothetical protein [Priestia megaterium]
MLKNKVGKLKTFTVDYSILKNNKIINNSIVMQSINDPDKIVRLAKLDISTKERVFIQNVKILRFKSIPSHEHNLE